MDVSTKILSSSTTFSINSDLEPDRGLPNLRPIGEPSSRTWGTKMLNGLYKVEFQTPLGAGAGVVVVQDGKIQGGDSTMYYTGNVTENGQDFSAQVESRVHTPVSGIRSVFGVNHAHIKLVGKINGDTAVAQGSAAEAPGLIFQAQFSKIH
jgi:T3SS negative regulator,GrlR